VPAPYSSRELVAALTEMGYQPVARAGSHLKRRYVPPETGDIRTVTFVNGFRFIEDLIADNS
jgi:predicted RNA binding protein YcfA (HicA-like mRNA interferase family)